MKNKQQGIGIWVLVAGVVILLGKLGVFSFIGAVFWPILIIIPGIMLHFLFFAQVFSASILIPGGILTTYGLLFLFCNWFGWNSMQYLWPFFIFGVAAGLYEYYMFSNPKPRAAYNAALILTLIFVLIFIVTLIWAVGIYVIAVALILIGLVLVCWGRRLRW